MNPDDIVGIVERIAEMLTPGAQQAWRIALQQAVTQGTIASLHCLIALVIGLLLVRWGARLLHRAPDASDGGDSMVGGVLVVVFGLIALAGATSSLTDAIACFTNPEYQAIKILMGLVGR